MAERTDTTPLQKEEIRADLELTEQEFVNKYGVPKNTILRHVFNDVDAWNDWNRRRKRQIDEATQPQAQKPVRKWSVGDVVHPKVGPHKGEPHKVIHVHPDGSMNIVPQVQVHAQNKYRLGAARCTDDQIDMPITDKQQRGLDKRNTPKAEKPSKEGHVAVKDAEGKFAGRFKSQAEAEKKHSGGGVTFHPIKLSEDFEYELLGEPVHEVSRDLLHRYFDKAATSRGRAERDGDTATVAKRDRGTGTAYTKMSQGDLGSKSSYKPKFVGEDMIEEGAMADLAVTAAKHAHENKMDPITARKHVSDTLMKVVNQHTGHDRTKIHNAASDAVSHGMKHFHSLRESSTSYLLQQAAADNKKQLNENAKMKKLHAEYNEAIEKRDYVKAALLKGKMKKHIHFDYQGTLREDKSELAALYTAYNIASVSGNKEEALRIKAEIAKLEKFDFDGTLSEEHGGNFYVLHEGRKVSGPHPSREQATIALSNYAVGQKLNESNLSIKKENLNEMIEEGHPAFRSKNREQGKIVHVLADDHHLERKRLEAPHLEDGQYGPTKTVRHGEHTLAVYQSGYDERRSAPIMSVRGTGSRPVPHHVLHQYAKSIAHQDDKFLGESEAVNEISIDLARNYSRKAINQIRREKGNRDLQKKMKKRDAMVDLASQKVVDQDVKVKARNLDEGQIAEVSGNLLDRYIRKASGDFTMAKTGERNTYGDGKKYWQKTADKRKKGIAQAYNKLDAGEGRQPEKPVKVPSVVREDEQIDEISRDRKIEYLKHVTDSGGFLRSPKPASLAGLKKKVTKTVKDGIKKGGFDLGGESGAFMKYHKREKIMNKVAKSVGLTEDEQINEVATHHVHIEDSKGRSHGKIGIKAFDDAMAQRHAERIVGNKPFRGMKITKITRAKPTATENEIKGIHEIEQLDEKRAYVEPFTTADGKQGYKSSNKHGKVKFWNEHGKASAYKHAGLNEENEMINEARRGRPPKNGAGREENEREHIIVQLRKNVSINGTKPIRFADNSEHSVDPAHAERALAHYAGLGPAHKEQFQKHIETSHANLMNFHTFKPKDETSKVDYRPLTGKDARTIKKPGARTTERSEEDRRHDRTLLIKRIAKKLRQAKNS